MNGNDYRMFSRNIKQSKNNLYQFRSSQQYIRYASDKNNNLSIRYALRQIYDGIHISFTSKY